MDRQVIIVKPAEPRLPAQLEDWLNDDDDELEFGEVLVANEDLSFAESLDADTCKITGTTFGPSLRKIRIHDSELEKVQFIGCKPETLNITRAHIAGSRLTGADFGGAYLEDCVFTGTKLDDAGFKMTVCRRVVFDNCVLTRADFSGAQLQNVVFKNCTLDGAQFSGAICRHVDVREQDITQIKGILGLKGSLISSEQLTQIAPILATELHFVVD